MAGGSQGERRGEGRGREEGGKVSAPDITKIRYKILLNLIIG